MKLSRALMIGLSTALSFGFSGCAKEGDTTQEQSETHAETNRQPSTVTKQQDGARDAFTSLQKACKAKDVEGYLALWDVEAKMADGRDLSLDERLERQRAALLERPEKLQRIANAKIESITLDTSKAEGVKSILGIDLEGTMMLVRTDGPNLFFRETDKGWKLNSIRW